MSNMASKCFKDYFKSFKKLDPEERRQNYASGGGAKGQKPTIGQLSKVLQLGG
jgi:hypothetical protein